MGMAASQARFLGLTARKTNVEYEGQQVNQQRTTLSNQSANYYNQLLGMTVPTPPSVDDYTKTVYSFNDGALNNTVTALIAQADGTYLVSYTSSWTDDFSVVSAGSSIVTREQIGATADYNYYIGSKQLRTLGVITPEQRQNDEYLKTLSDDQIANLIKEEEEYKKMLDEQYGQGDWQVRYVLNTTTKTWTPYFYKKEDLDGADYSDNGSSQSYIPAYTVGSTQKTKEHKGVTARIEQDSSGRLINITLIDPVTNQETTYALSTETTTDQSAYQDAMNQYEYDKYQYDQSIQEINAKIEIVQAEDKNLELRLKQLDTEQDAIQTEMDAVQKVIEKNTESTFKTFG